MFALNKPASAGQTPGPSLVQQQQPETVALNITKRRPPLKKRGLGLNTPSSLTTMPNLLETINALAIHSDASDMSDCDDMPDCGGNGEHSGPSLVEQQTAKGEIVNFVNEPCLDNDEDDDDDNLYFTEDYFNNAQVDEQAPANGLIETDDNDHPHQVDSTYKERLFDLIANDKSIDAKWNKPTLPGKLSSAGEYWFYCPRTFSLNFIVW